MLLQVDIGRGEKPAGYYVQRSCGLFPSPMPQDQPCVERVERLFELMGTFFAKCIQDSRLVDMPLSRPFLKLMCCGDVVDNVATSYRESLAHHDTSLTEVVSSPPDDDLTPTEESEKELIYEAPRKRASASTVAECVSTPWYTGLLTQDDFLLVEPVRARFLQQLIDLAARKAALMADDQLSVEERNNRLQQLTLDEAGTKVEDLR
jgi:E3 ubiquitin-protein ligase HECTD1